MKNEKIKFRDRLKDISAGLGDSLKESTLWGSISNTFLGGGLNADELRTHAKGVSG